MRKPLICLVALSLVLCLSEPVLAAKGTVRIGVYLPMTGPAANYGQMEWAGIQTANKLMPKVLSTEVELFLVDTKSDKIEAANAVAGLIKKNRVHAIIGEATSDNTLAGGSIADKAKKPMVSPTATNSLVTQNKKYVFRVCFTDPFQGKMAAKYAYDKLGARKAAILVDIAQDYSVGLTNVFAKTFIKHGGKVVSMAYCQTLDRDFTVQISSIIAAKPDVLYMPNNYTEVALACKQAVKLGLNVPIISTDRAQTKELIKIGGKDVEGIIFTGQFAREAAVTNIAKKYIETYEKDTGKEASAFDALGADAYFVLMDAIKRAKSVKGKNIRNALASTKNFKAVSGIINIGEDGNAIKSLALVHVKDGTFRYLAMYHP